MAYDSDDNFDRDPQVAKALEAAWKGVTDPSGQDGWDANAVWARVASRTSSVSRSGDVVRKSSHRQWSSWWNVAWIIPAVAMIGVKYLKHDSKPTVSHSSNYITQPGQRATITLSNGSRVTLGPATTLGIQQISNNQIIANVNGEALFKVQQSATHPFIVTAHGITTRVLGTEFVVRAYDASRVRIAVRSGKVSVQPQALTTDNAVVVGANQAVSVLPDAIPEVTSIADVATDFAWADGELVLRNVPLGEALVRMSRWYNKDFRVADSSLLRLRIETVLPADYSQERIRGLAKVLGAQVIQDGRAVTFSKSLR